MPTPLCLPRACRRAGALLLLLAACVPAPVDVGESEGEAASESDSAACHSFEPFIIDVMAEPNGLFYRADQGRLYIADDDNNRVLTWSDDGTLGVFAEIPNPSGDPGSDGLGDLDFAADGTLYVPRFGFGMPGLGAIFQVSASGEASEVAGVNDEWRRVGLDYDDARGLIYVATYSRDADDVYTGWISAVDPIAGVETKILEGLSKPVGIAVIGDALFVGDQAQRRLYRVDLEAATPALSLVSDEFEALDLMEATPDGALLVLSYDNAVSAGRVLRVTPEGAITVVAEGSWEPRGITFDGVSRIFVSARDTQTIVVVPAC
ncbi:MAG: hypothetical protein R3A79_19405 [Nannocystaceae bacterium]